MGDHQRREIVAPLGPELWCGRCLGPVESPSGPSVVQRGRRMVISDAGRTWTAWRVPAPFRSGLQQENWIQMLNPRDGWMDAGFALWTTDDGGKRWHKSSYLLVGPFGADFVSPSTGWALNGALNGRKKGKPTSWHYRVMSTADGGRRWTIHGTRPMLGMPAEITFANPSQGWIVVPHGLLATTDGGARWTQIRLPHVQPASVSVSGHVLSLVTINGRLLMSTNGGMHWRTIINGRAIPSGGYRIHDRQSHQNRLGPVHTTPWLRGVAWG